MKKVKISENGELCDAESGEVVGRKAADGKVISTALAEPPVVKEASIPRESTTAYSRYEVRPDSEFEVRFCLGFKDDRVMVYTADAWLKHPELEQHWVKFRMWNYEEELAWKNQCMEYNSAMRTLVQNQARLDELKVRNLIRSWSFAKIDDRFRLLHVNRVLSDESYEVFRGFFPTIINNIIFLMNQVLEQNG